MRYCQKYIDNVKDYYSITFEMNLSDQGTLKTVGVKKGEKVLSKGTRLSLSPTIKNIGILFSINLGM